MSWVCSVLSAAVVSWFSSAPCAGLKYVGVNLAGAEFAEHVLPGTYGKDYTYPTQQELAYYASKGLTALRVPFRWERMQKALEQPLDDQELARLRTVVTEAAKLKMFVVLDAHNYGMRDGQVIGSEAVPDEAFGDFWRRMASAFKADSNVLFGLMNEPHKQSASSWIKSANTAISKIREAGARQRILVPGTGWTGAWSWTTSQNADVVGAGVVDPAHTYSFELHQYLDPDNSGRTRDVVGPMIGADRLKAATMWAAEHKVTLFLGEFGAADDPASLQALQNMLQYVSEHSSVWIGATYWAGGPWWYGSNIYGIEPTGLGTKDVIDRPQLKILQSLLKSR